MRGNGAARLCLITLFLGTIFASLLRGADDFDGLREKWCDTLTGGRFDASDPDIAAEIRRLDEAGKKAWTSLERDRARSYLWPDLANPTNSAHITRSLRRIKDMALGYVSPGSSLHGDPKLLADILGALEWIFRHRYNETVAIYDNEWDWKMGSPIALNDIAVLLYPQLCATPQMREYLATMERFSADTSYHGPSTGANRTWRCKVMSLFGIVARRADRLERARAELLEEGGKVFSYQTSGDGFYRDGSFIQHERHPYTGGYGKELLRDLADLVYLLSDSPWAIPETAQQNLYRWMRQSYAPFVYRGEVMDAVRGREISRYNMTTRQAGRGLFTGFLRVAQFSPEPVAEEIKRVAKSWLRDDAVSLNRYDGLTIEFIAKAKRLEADAEIIPENGPVGFFSFPAMDRAVQRRPSWAAALSLYSSRVFNYESINGENLRGWNTGSGMLQIFTNDLDQFSDNYWPTIDAHRLPGTTVFASEKSPPSQLNGSDFVGSLKTYSGEKGLAVMEAAPLGQPLHAKKAWFFLEEAIVCLGSDISASADEAAETIVENRKLPVSENFHLTVNGEPRLISSVRSGVSDQAVPEKFSRVSHAHLAGSPGGKGMGYYLPELAELRGIRETRSGSWGEINAYLPNAALHTNRFLTLWIDHGTRPKGDHYAYAVLPDCSEIALARYERKPGFTILENSASVQAVKLAEENTVLAVFWNDDSHTLTCGKDSITCTGGGLVTATLKPCEVELTLTDPRQRREAAPVILELNRAEGRVIKKDAAITVLASSPKLRLAVDTTRAAGMGLSIKLEFSPGN